MFSTISFPMPLVKTIPILFNMERDGDSDDVDGEGDSNPDELFEFLPATIRSRPLNFNTNRALLSPCCSVMSTTSCPPFCMMCKYLKALLEAALSLANQVLVSLVYPSSFLLPD